MTRPPAALEYVTASGEMRGFDVTPRDLWVLRNVTRWYVMSTLQLVRNSPAMDVASWHPDLGGDPEYFERDHPGYSQRMKYTARVMRMARVLETGPGGAAPMLSSAWVGRYESVHSATTFGARMCGLNGWVNNNTISPYLVRHAVAATDIGTQLERTMKMDKVTDVHVLSERELRRSDTIRHTQERDGVFTIPAQFESEYHSANGAKPVTKIPDVAITNGSWDRYIAVEVERETDRPLHVYIEKLQAFRRNPSIDAVWYVCANEAAQRRVMAAADRVFGTNFARLRVTVAHQKFGFWQIRGLEQHHESTRPFHEDLHVLRTRQQRRGMTYEGMD